MKTKIRDLSHDGRGIGSIENKTVFVENAYPEEVVEVEVLKDKKKYLEGRQVRLIEKSPNRVESICEDFYRCNGCQFCDYKYSAQLEYKKSRVKNDFKKFGNIDLEDLKIVGMEDFYNYRNHVQFKIKNDEIGYIDKKENKVFTPRNCIVAPKDSDKIIEILKSYSKISMLETVGIRENHLGEKMIILVMPVLKARPLRPGVGSSGGLAPILDIEERIQELKKYKVTHIYQNYNDNSKNHYGRESIKLFGEGEFQEEILGNKFILSPSSFFQVNRKQAEILYKKGISNLDLNKEDKVLELYSGIGTISLEIGKEAGQVTGIEYSEVSVEDGNKNIEMNELDNIDFISGKVEEKLEEFKGKYNKLLLDPPRAGVDKKVIDGILELEPERISYISCDPATLARDVGLLIENGKYRLEDIEIVDMFPLTSHVEALVLMTR